MQKTKFSFWKLAYMFMYYYWFSIINRWNCSIGKVWCSAHRSSWTRNSSIKGWTSISFIICWHG